MFERSRPLEATRRQPLAAGGGAVLADVAKAVSRSQADGARGFDFLLGRWIVEHRRLKERLVGSEQWEEFPGTLDVKPILHGLGNVDENLLSAPGGQYLATSLRVFDPAAALWSVYWMDGRGWGIDKPVIGGFRGRVGRFYNEDMLDGRPIRVRFTYRDLGRAKASWEQAFSDDGGASWEVNWTMDFFRRSNR